MIEATSGNTGIGLAMVCAAKGYPLVVTMADSFSIERRKLMRFLGAKVVLTPRAEKGFGMVQKAQELARRTAGSSPGSSRPTPMRRSTRTPPAREILADFDGRAARLLRHRLRHRRHHDRVSAACCASRARRPKSFLSEPANAQLLGSGVSPGAQRRRRAGGQPPAFEPHPIQGWTPDFIPLVLQESIDKGLYDEVIPVPGPVGIEWSGRLAREEGIFTGISGGATFAIAMQIAEKAEKPARSSFACCPTPASATSPRRSSRASPRT